MEAAKADAERIKVLGLAEANAIADVGKADAERMLTKAKVYKQYGDAAIMALVLEALPKVLFKWTFYIRLLHLLYVTLYTCFIKDINGLKG